MFPIKMSLSKLLEPCVFAHRAFQWKGTLGKCLKCKCSLQRKGSKSIIKWSSMIIRLRIVQKSWAFLSVLTWQLLLWQLNWVICPCRCCSSINAVKDKSAGRGVWKEKAQCNASYNTDRPFCHSSPLTRSFFFFFYHHQHLWLICHLRAPPRGRLFPGVCLTLWTYGLCAQVLDWIENHGEAFLSKHTGVGKSLHRARALQKRHEDFEEVAQVAWFCFCNFHSRLFNFYFDSYNYWLRYSVKIVHTKHMMSL